MAVVLWTLHCNNLEYIDTTYIHFTSSTYTEYYEGSGTRRKYYADWSEERKGRKRYVYK